MTRLIRDVRQAVRGLRHRLSIAVFVVLTFGLGIGVTTAVFSLFYGVLMKPLPYQDPDQLVMVFDVQPACDQCPASFPKLDDWTQGSSSFSAIAGSSRRLAVVTGTGEPERVPVAQATWSFVDVFGIQPALGRFYTEAEDQPGGPKVVILSHGYWLRAFGGEPTTLGRRMTINGESHEILGIMPAGFSHRGADLILPVQMAVDPGDRGSHFLATYARLKPDVSLEQGRQEMQALGERLQEEFGHNHGIDVQSYSQLVTGDVVTPLRLLMGAVSLVLLIACANVANLLLASGLARRRELAVRTALGATGWDLVRQLTVESVVLALAGGALGLLLAVSATNTFVALAEGTLPRMSAVGFDGIVLAFTVALSFATGMLCGLWPVVRLRRRSVSGDMREGDLRSGSASGGRQFGNGLVVAEVALAFCLLVAAGLLIRNLVALEARPTGFETERRVAFDIAPTGSRYEEPEQRLELYRALQARLAATPGVERVGSTSHLPMYEFGWNGEVTLVGGNPWPDDEAPLINWRWVGGDYLDTMGIALIAGRWFNGTDREGAPRAAILSEMTAEKFWPREDPIGRRLSQGGPNNPQFEVVGIVAGVRARSLLRGSEYEMYIPIAQDPFQWQTFIVRTASPDPTSVMPQVRQIVRDLDPMLPVSEVQTLDAVVRESVDQPRLISSLAALFGTLAALLAAVGVYGVMAHNVRRERRAYGIRLALGADPSHIRRFVAGRGVKLGGLGIALGGGTALLLTRYVELLLNDVQPTDPVVYATCAVGLLAVTLLAGYLPARAASRTDPITVLRAD